MSISIRIEGLDEIQRNLDALGQRIESAAEHLVDYLIDEGETEAVRIVPVRTGNLLRSISRGKITRFLGYVMAAIHYALYVELGTWRMAARPYLRPALELVSDFNMICQFLRSEIFR